MQRRAVWLPLLLITGLLASCGATPQPAAVPTAAGFGLEVVGPGRSTTLSLDEVKALPAVEGWGGIKDSVGRISPPAPYKGVALEELCALVGGLRPDQGVRIVATDGYAMTMSYHQVVNGDFITYDPGAGDENDPGDRLTVILAYEREGQPLPEDTDGVLRIVVVSSKNNQVVDGHWSVKWVQRIEVRTLAQEWSFHLEGVLAEDVDRGTFESCAAESCHGVTWTDEKAQSWSGVPLWLLVGRVDDETRHGGGAYSEPTADQGYTVDVTAADGYTVSFDSARLKRNDGVIVAHLVNGNALDENDFPLRLVGSDLQKKEMVGQIARVVLTGFGQAPAPTAVPPTPEPTQAPPAAGVAALAVTGAVDSELTLTPEALQGMEVIQITAEHPKKGPQEYEGVRLNALLDRAGVKAGATEVVFTAGDGYSVSVPLADVRACADCLVAFSDGALSLVMPGMESSTWVKGLVVIELR